MESCFVFDRYSVTCLSRVCEVESGKNLGARADGSLVAIRVERWSARSAENVASLCESATGQSRLLHQPRWLTSERGGGELGSLGEMCRWRPGS